MTQLSLFIGDTLFDYTFYLLFLVDVLPTNCYTCRSRYKPPSVCFVPFRTIQLSPVILPPLLPSVLICKSYRCRALHVHERVSQNFCSGSQRQVVIQKKFISIFPFFLWMNYFLIEEKKIWTWWLSTKATRIPNEKERTMDQTKDNAIAITSSSFLFCVCAQSESLESEWPSDGAPN